MKALSKKYIILIYALALVLSFFSLETVCFAKEADCSHNDTVTVLGKEPDCNEEGYTEGVYCNDCESFISGHEIIPVSHVEIPFRRVEPTCTSVGYTEGIYCSDCESFISGHEEIPVVDHSGEYREAIAPTCTEIGYTEGTICSVCESWLSGHEVIPAAHKEAIIPKEPETCTKDGYTEGIYCTVCETLLSGRDVIPSGHREVFVEQEPATCTGNGYTSGMYCTVCNVYTSGHVEIPFVSHNFTEKIPDDRHLVQKATSESPAIYRYDCATCTAISPDRTYPYGLRLPVGATAGITAAQSSSAIRLKWSPVAGADGYVIYYKSANGWKALRNVTVTTDTFTGLNSGTMFTFAVRAYQVNDGKYSLSHDYTTIQTATKSAAPAKIAAKQNTSAIKLMWTPVKGVSGYRIYYRTKTSGWKICVKSTPETSHTFTNLPSGKTYQFAVRTYIATDYGYVSGEYRTFITATVPTAPTTSAASPAPRHVSVSWSAVSGADGYQLLYRINNGEVKIYKAYTSPQSLMFSGLASGSRITFAVRAIKKTESGYIFGGYKAATVQIR